MEWKIGNVTIPNQIVVAPMAGITNSAFRVTAREFGAGLTVCEMISDQGIKYRNEKTLGMMFVDPKEHPVSIQIFGGSVKSLVQAAKFVDDNTSADIIDINMGCPVKKVTKTGAGSCWLRDPDHLYEAVKAVSSAISKPLTVKMRTGWDDDHILAVENALAAQEGGASAIAMHGRTKAQMYMGHANWDILHEVAQSVSIPFMGNGDIKTPQDAKTMIEDVGADAAMVGRAVLGNLWRLNAMNHYLETGELLPEPSVPEKINIAKLQLQRLVDLKGEHVGVPEFRQQAAYYLKGIPHAVRTRAKVVEEDSMQEVFDTLDQFVESYEKREARSSRIS
ncbi:tRNA dihydrouridine synthase DusB [Companilactobacillus kimchii]|uniref:tRNA-dihydrouridine synthase n=2 Tax=Companilactobacillus kimchii TaxID=2801452 RepID=A0ABR5NU01_9LACO|nr:tRNA dihydrouridine synthase DusB [Companilactobacillus kimchii]GEO47808.1 tRNA-dihydrouridine synthase [Companilactobacillus paralimentarius]KAE9558706.1 tRNA-dihydrouridine synthase [Companilactobacillus kimchii]KAE9560935.1 tRNA-dihydrouridine synthase [Companilactobacillus kimchii]KRK51836.1 tRNA-dihydrouridine synthase [Companilactobacillus kimchii DSM 13961 = JCM 10707]OWF33872.1 tRNA-dihydrouridine synthase B [Companilactobacillus kimchii]